MPVSARISPAQESLRLVFHPKRTRTSPQPMLVVWDGFKGVSVKPISWYSESVTSRGNECRANMERAPPSLRGRFETGRRMWGRAPAPSLSWFAQRSVARKFQPQLQCFNLFFHRSSERTRQIIRSHFLPVPAHQLQRGRLDKRSRHLPAAARL